MTTPEDRLRALLQHDEIVPTGDGLRLIAERLAARRSLRARLVPAAAVAGVVALAGAAAVTVSLTDAGSLKTARHATVTDPQPTACAEGLCADPKPSPTDGSATVTTSGPGTPVWPFTTDAEAAEWEADPGSRGWASDPVQVTQHLLDDYLTLPGKVTRRVDAHADTAVVEVSAGGRPVSQVQLVQVGRDTRGPWSVVGATSDDLTVTQPSPGDEITSPLHTAGTVSGVDQSVDLRLLTTSLLGETHAPAGNELPWTSSLPWTRTDWSVAALAASTYNGKGDLSAVTVTAVRRGGAAAAGPPAGSVLVAVDQGHVVSVDAATGTVLRQLSYPPAGAVDAGPDRGGEDGVVWVRTTGPHACTSEILRAGLAHGPAGVTVEAKPVVRSLPSLSSGGRSLGWVEQDCGGGAATVVVRGPDAKFSTTATSSDGVDDLDVRDDGYAVVQTGRVVRVLAPGAADVSVGHALAADPGCAASAPAWDGDVVVAWQHCARGWQLVRWSAAGAPLQRGAFLAGMSAVLHTATAQGQVLAALADHRLVRVADGALVDVPDEQRWGQADW